MRGVGLVIVFIEDVKGPVGAVSDAERELIIPQCSLETIVESINDGNHFMDERDCRLRCNFCRVQKSLKANCKHENNHQHNWTNLQHRHHLPSYPPLGIADYLIHQGEAFDGRVDGGLLWDK